MYIKLALDIGTPEKDDKLSIEEKMLDCMERVEYGTDREAFKYLKRLNNYLICKYKDGKCNDKMNSLLSKLTPFMSEYGLSSGVDLIAPMVTNPDYKKDTDEED